MSGREPGARFDAQYFARYYEDPRTRVSSRKQAQRLAGFIAGYVRYLELPVRRILELGPGVGYLRDGILEHFPRASYRGVELSEYLCEKYGWERGSVETYCSPRRFDLVLCQGVLQYLPNAAAGRAIDNLAQLCHGALYLEALTRQDWQHNVDRELTDSQVHLRSGSFYRKRLAPHFHNCGGGLFLAREAEATLFELEKLE